MTFVDTPPDESARELLRLLGGPASAGPSDGMPWIPVWRVRAGATLALEGAPLEFVHVVRSGYFKVARVWQDGYEHMLTLAAKGDLIGFDGLHLDRHAASVVALEDCTVWALPAADLTELCRRCPPLARGLQSAQSRQLAVAEKTAEMLAAVGANTRLARFLLWFAERMAERGESARRLRLPLLRRDLASLLGVAHETVCRSFVTLQSIGHVRVDGRDIEIVDPDGLRLCAQITRRPGGDDEAHPLVTAHSHKTNSSQPSSAADRMAPTAQRQLRQAVPVIG